MLSPSLLDPCGLGLQACAMTHPHNSYDPQHGASFRCWVEPPNTRSMRRRELHAPKYHSNLMRGY